MRTPASAGRPEAAAGSLPTACLVFAAGGAVAAEEEEEEAVDEAVGVVEATVQAAMIPST